MATTSPRRKMTTIILSILGAVVGVLVLLIVIGLTVGDTSSTTADDKHGGLTPEQRASARAEAGIPPEPTGQARRDYLDALRAIDPWFVDDKGEQDAIDNGVNQCSQIDSDRAVYFAQQRFGKGDIRPVSEAEAEKLNDAVRKYICPDA